MPGITWVSVRPRRRDRVQFVHVDLVRDSNDENVNSLRLRFVRERNRLVSVNRGFPVWVWIFIGCKFEYILGKFCDILHTGHEQHCVSRSRPISIFFLEESEHLLQAVSGVCVS